MGGGNMVEKGWSGFEPRGRTRVQPCHGGLDRYSLSTPQGSLHCKIGVVLAILATYTHSGVQNIFIGKSIGKAQERSGSPVVREVSESVVDEVYFEAGVDVLIGGLSGEDEDDVVPVDRVASGVVAQGLGCLTIFPGRAMPGGSLGAVSRR